MTDILTLTLNPAVDVFTSTAQVLPTHKLRCTQAQQHAGGGGINVARVVHRLGGDCTALYPVGGVTGNLLKALLDAEGVTSACVEIAGQTRQSFSVSETSKQLEYRFVLPGPPLQESEWQACLAHATRPQPPPRFIVASGSLPPAVPVDFYARLIRLCKPHGIKVVIDTSGPALAAALEEGVYLVKPSLRELRELVGQALETEPAWCQAAQSLIAQGKAEMVVLTLGEDGAWLFTADVACYAPALSIPVVSAIGAGDSFVAAMVWALSQGNDVKSAFRYGVAAASAALGSCGTGLCWPSEVARLYPTVVLRCTTTAQAPAEA
jgi:6-phosphofructokinase 2